MSAEDRPSYRGTGRTTRAIQAVPPNGVYLVAREEHIRYCERIAREQFGRTDIRFMSLGRAMQGAILGLRGPVSLDHYAVEYALDSYRGQRFQQDYHALLLRVQAINHRWEQEQSQQKQQGEKR